jgi:hypothetical protein
MSLAVLQEVIVYTPYRCLHLFFELKFPLAQKHNLSFQGYQTCMSSI